MTPQYDATTEWGTSPNQLTQISFLETPYHKIESIKFEKNAYAKG